MSAMDDFGVPVEKVNQGVVTVFLADTPTKIRELKLACQAGNSDAARRLAHYLKGSAMYINARQMSTVCAEIQSLAAAKDKAALSEALARLEQEFARVSSRLKQQEEQLR